MYGWQGDILWQIFNKLAPISTGVLHIYRGHLVKHIDESRYMAWWFFLHCSMALNVFYSVGSLLIIRVFSSFGDAGIVGHVLNMTLNKMKQKIWEYISRIVRTVLCSESSKIKSIFTKPPVIFDRTYPCKCPF